MKLIPNPKLTLKYALLAPLYYKNWFVYYGDLLRQFSGKKIVLRLRSGVSFNLIGGSGGKDIINEVFIDKVYENQRYDIYIKDTDHVLDIGAHIGTFTSYASKISKKGTVYAFEPVKGTYDLLDSNVKLNNFTNVKTFNKGMYSTAKTTRIEKSRLYSGSFSIYSSFMQGIGLNVDSYESVELIGINDFLKFNTIDFAKIDCEGSEYEIIYNMNLEYLSRIRCLVIEYHNITDATASFTGDSLKNYLESKNFKVHQINLQNIKSVGYLYCRNLSIN